MDMHATITKVLERAAIDGTLSDAAIEHYRKTVEENKTLKTDLDKSTKEKDELQDTVNELRKQYLDVSGQLQDWRNRNTELCEREDKMLKLELIAQYEAERVTDHKEMFGLVFRNLNIRRAISSNGSMPTGDGYSGNTNEYRTETDSIE